VWRGGGSALFSVPSMLCVDMQVGQDEEGQEEVEVGSSLNAADRGRRAVPPRRTLS